MSNMTLFLLGAHATVLFLLMYWLGHRDGAARARVQAEADRLKRERAFRAEIVGGHADGKTLTLTGTFNDVTFPVQVLEDFPELVFCAEDQTMELSRPLFREVRYVLDHAVYREVAT